MIDAKPWYLSKTVWGAVIAIGASFAGLAGLHIDSSVQASLVDAAFQIASAAGGLIALLGRISASHKLF
jgi:hypothetical protein